MSAVQTSNVSSCHVNMLSTLCVDLSVHSRLASTGPQTG